MSCGNIRRVVIEKDCARRVINPHALQGKLKNFRIGFAHPFEAGIHHQFEQLIHRHQRTPAIRKLFYVVGDDRAPQAACFQLGDLVHKGGTQAAVAGHGGKHLIDIQLETVILLSARHDFCTAVVQRHFTALKPVPGVVAVFMIVTENNFLNLPRTSPHALPDLVKSGKGRQRENPTKVEQDCINLRHYFTP